MRTQHETECPFIKVTKAISYTIALGSVVLLGYIIKHGVIDGGFTNAMAF